MQPNFAIDDATAANLAEAFQIAGSDKVATSEAYDVSQLLALVQAWDDDHRFPRELY
jgi:hypothetical protein